MNLEQLTSEINRLKHNPQLKPDKALLVSSYIRDNFKRVYEFTDPF